MPRATRKAVSWIGMVSAGRLLPGPVMDKLWGAGAFVDAGLYRPPWSTIWWAGGSEIVASKPAGIPRRDHRRDDYRQVRQAVSDLFKTVKVMMRAPIDPGVGRVRGRARSGEAARRGAGKNSAAGCCSIICGSCSIGARLPWSRLVAPLCRPGRQAGAIACAVSEAATVNPQHATFAERHLRRIARLRRRRHHMSAPCCNIRAWRRGRRRWRSASTPARVGTGGAGRGSMPA